MMSRFLIFEVVSGRRCDPFFASIFLKMAGSSPFRSSSDVELAALGAVFEHGLALAAKQLQHAFEIDRLGGVHVERAARCRP